MASNTSILINVGAQTAAAVRNLNSVTKELDSQQKKSGGWGGSLKKAGAVAATGFLAAGAAIVGIGASMVQFAKDAIADAKAAGTLADTLGNLPGVTQKVIDKNSAWIDSMELATAVSDDKLRAAMGKLAVATGSVEKAQKLTALATDVATARNISMEAATKLLEKAAVGNTAALERQMPWLDANKDGTIKLDEAVSGLTKKYSGAAEAASNRDPYQKLNVIWGQLREALGQWVLPLLDKFSDWFKDKDNQKKIQDTIAKIAEFSRELGEDLVKALQDAYKWLKSEEGQKALKDLKNLFGDLSGAIKTVAGWFDTINGYKFVIYFNPLVVIADTLQRIKDLWSVVGRFWDRITGSSARRSGGGTFSALSSTYSAYGIAAPSPGLNRAAGQYDYIKLSAPTAGPTIIVNGALDAEGVARQIQSILTTHDVRQGRPVGAALARAW